MKYALIGALAVLIACAFVLPAVPMSSLEKTIGLNHSSQVAPTSGSEDSENETGDHDNETIENDIEMEDFEANDVNGTLLAGGGGWFEVNMSGTIHKDTFGVFIDGDSGNWSYSGLVLQARDQQATIHGLNFTKVVFDNTTVANMTYVHAWGWASFDKVEGFWFHLILMDNGSRSNDLFDFALYKDTDKNWTMDETSPLLHWVANGLDGGNIWVVGGVSESDE